jgi:hypothetical protein
MKNFRLICVIALYLVVQRVNAQDFKMNEFSDMTLNGLSMNILMQENASRAWALIRAEFGRPLKEYEDFIESRRKYFEYSGAMFIYDDNLGDFMLLLVEITSSNYVFTYDGLQIKVGNNISTLSAKFPLKYNKRSEGEMYISHIVADIWMAIYYDSNNVITKIKLEQNLL